MTYAVLKYCPRQPMTERMEWQTDIIPAFSAEQRIALRVVPRTIFNLDWNLSHAEFAELKTLLATWANGQFAVPVWTEGTEITAISSPATTITAAVSNADYYSGGYCAIVAANGDVTVKALSSVGGSSLTLTTAYIGSTGAYVYPCKLGYFYDGFQFARDGARVAVSGTFTTTEGQDLAAATGYDTYSSLDVVTDGYYLRDGVSESILRSVDMFDNGSGPIETDTQRNYLTRGGMANFITLTRANRMTLRKHLHNVKGRRGAFWLPSYNADLTVVADIASGQPDIQVSALDYATYGGAQAIMILKTDGTRAYNTINSAAAGSPATTEVLTCSANFASPIAAADIAKACFMHKVRFDSDVIEINHESYQHGNTSHEHVSVSVPVREVPN